MLFDSNNIENDVRCIVFELDEEHLIGIKRKNKSIKIYNGSR